MQALFRVLLTLTRMKLNKTWWTRRRSRGKEEEVVLDQEDQEDDEEQDKEQDKEDEKEQEQKQLVYSVKLKRQQQAQQLWLLSFWSKFVHSYAKPAFCG